MPGPFKRCTCRSCGKMVGYLKRGGPAKHEGDVPGKVCHGVNLTPLEVWGRCPVCDLSVHIYSGGRFPEHTRDVLNDKGNFLREEICPGSGSDYEGPENALHHSA